MSELTRYKFIGHDDDDIVQHTNGDLIELADHNKIVNELTKRIEQLKAALRHSNDTTKSMARIFNLNQNEIPSISHADQAIIANTKG